MDKDNNNNDRSNVPQDSEVRSVEKKTLKKKIFTIIFWIVAVIVWLCLALVYQIGMEVVNETDHENDDSEVIAETEHSGVAFVTEASAGDEIREAWRNDPSRSEYFRPLLDYMANTDMQTPSLEKAVCAAAYGDIDLLREYRKQGFARLHDPMLLIAAAGTPCTDVMEFLLEEIPAEYLQDQRVIQALYRSGSLEMLKFAAVSGNIVLPLSGIVDSPEKLAFILNNTTVDGEECEILLQEILMYGTGDLLEFFNNRFNDYGVKYPLNMHFAASCGNLEILEKLIASGVNTAVVDQQYRTPVDYAVAADEFAAAGMLLENGSYFTLADAGGIQLALAADNPAAVRKLLAAGISPNAVLPSGKSILQYAVSKDKELLARELITAGASLAGAFRFADSAAMIKLLLEAGGEPNVLDNTRRTPLFYAASSGKTDNLKLLAAYGADINSRDDDNMTPLMCAAYSGNLEAVKFLISAGADVNAVSNRGETALHFAAAGGFEAIAEVLLESGADAGVVTNNGFSVIRTAAEYDKWAMVELLLRHGAALESPDSISVLYMAAASGRLEDIKILTENGADIHKLRSDRGNILHQVLDGVSPDRDAMVEFLTEKGVDIDCANLDGETPLHRALLLGYEKTAAALVLLGADVTVGDENGKTPLHLCWKMPEAAAAIAEAGADCNAVDSLGCTPLHYAAGNNDIEFVQFLIEKGADREVRNHWKKKAADYTSLKEIKDLLAGKSM